MQRRQMLKAGAATVLAPFINRHRYRLFAASPLEYSARAIELVNGIYESCRTGQKVSL